MLNLTNDWHVGRALLRKWPAMLYAVYLAMAAGYALTGIGGVLEDPAMRSAGRHVLAFAAFGLGIFLVFAIAGRNHVGLALDERPWVPIGAALLVAAAIARGAAWWSAAPGWLVAASGGLWLGAFVLVVLRLVPLWLAARSDGAFGCDGPPTPGHDGCSLP
jgi:uncharacterized protein involved in response to NO